MNCKQAQHLLRTAGDAQIAADSGLQVHLASCEECGAMSRELKLIRLLATSPVPASSPGFADRALAQAWETAHPQPKPLRKPAYAWAGLAASVLLAGVLLLPDRTPRPAAPTVTQTVVQVVPQQAHPVHIRLVSKTALPDATIKIHWDKNLALEGYSTTSSLSWQNPLTAGVNQLTLPLVMTGGVGGEVVIEVTSGNAKKQMRFRVEPQPSAVAGLPPVSWSVSEYPEQTI
jgi:hypothetical protein